MMIPPCPASLLFPLVHFLSAQFTFMYVRAGVCSGVFLVLVSLNKSEHIVI